jgi:anti-anti-sigma factor
VAIIQSWTSCGWKRRRAPASFRLVGELDASNVDQVTARLREELSRTHQLTLDTTDLTFMGSQGLHMLIELGAEAVRLGTSVVVIRCSAQVKRLLDVAVPAGIPGVEIAEPEK